MSIITPPATLSYPAIDKPKALMDGGQMQYKASLVFAKDTDLSALEAAANAALVERWGSKATTMRKTGQLRWPIRDGSEKYGEGTRFLNCNSKHQPTVVSRYADASTGKPSIITDPAEIYPGIKMRASLSVFTYDRSGNKGVSFALGNLQKLADGVRLDRASAVDEFEALDDAPADFDDDTHAFGDK